MVGTYVARRASRRPRGAAAVEFALVLPILVVLLFGIISYGLMLSFRQSVSQAASEGVRAAAVAPTSANRQAIAYSAVEKVMGGSCNSGYLHCTTSTPASCSTCMAVTVTYDYGADPSKVKLLFGFALPDTLSYTATSQINQVSP